MPSSILEMPSRSLLSYFDHSIRTTLVIMGNFPIALQIMPPIAVTSWQRSLFGNAIVGSIGVRALSDLKGAVSFLPEKIT